MQARLEFTAVVQLNVAKQKKLTVAMEHYKIEQLIGKQYFKSKKSLEATFRAKPS